MRPIENIGYMAGFTFMAISAILHGSCHGPTARECYESGDKGNIGKCLSQGLAVSLEPVFVAVRTLNKVLM